MCNLALFKMEWKQNYKILIIFLLILTMYICIMISMFDPALGRVMEEFTKTMPELMAMVGMSGSTATLAQFLATYLYGLIMIVFPLIFIVMLAIRLLVRNVDNGFMAYLLSSGVDRKQVWMTQFLVLITNILTLVGYCTILGIVVSMFLFPDALDIMAFIRLNIGLFFLQVCFASIAFLCSSVCNEARIATMIGAGIPVVFVLIQMLSNMKGNLEGLKYATLITLFNTERLIAGNIDAYGMVMVLFVLALSCFGIGFIRFKKRNLPL